MSTSKHIGLRNDLTAIGGQRRESKRLRADAAEKAKKAIPAAVRAGIPVAEVARLADYSRKAVYELLPPGKK